jgi:hypothetical protein
MLTATLVGGCSCSKQSNENVSNLVIKVGDKEYSASDLYNQLLSTDTGANEAFAKVLRLVVESSMETTKNIQAAADLAVESLEEEAATNAKSNGTTKAEERKTLLEEQGYSSIDEMKADIIYNQKLTRLTETYWEENKESYYSDYVENRLPYLVRHVLVKIDDNTSSAKIANNVSVSQSEAKKLYDVIKRFESGDKFSYIANQESDDSGSTSTGGAYYMDNTYGVNGFVDEFVYGTYAFDAYTTKNVDNDGNVSYTFGKDTTKVGKLTGLTDTETFATYYENGFNFVSMDLVNALGNVYNQTSQSNKDYFTISAVEKVTGDNGDVSYSASSNNLNSSDNYYARSIIFNRAFNKTGVSVIGYDTKEEAEAAATNYVEFKMSDTETKYILADENSNPIFFVAARGSSNDIWVHFLTINVSALDDLEDAKKFFTMSPDSTDNYTTYVELMNTAGTTKGANTIISEIESYVKSYATYGIGSTVGEESILNYDMVEHYISENNIEYINEQLKTAIESYITNKRTLLKTKLLNSMSDDWDTHTDKLASNMSELVQMGVKPYECGVLISDSTTTRENPYTALSTSSYLCRYVYGQGYQVQLLFYYETSSSSSSSYSFQNITTSTSNNLYFDSDSSYNEVQWVTIGENSSEIVLPTPTAKSGYYFEGWYTDQDLTHKVTSIDLSKSSMYNNTIFFAKIVSSATTINYTYEYSDGSSVGEDVASAITNSNTSSATYSATGDNTITLSTDKVTSENVTAVKFLNESGAEITSIELTSADYATTKTIRVVVDKKSTSLEYVYVNDEGDTVDVSADTNNNPTTATYTADGDTVSIKADEISISGYTVSEIRIARDDDTFNTAESIEDGFELLETDMGKTITIYVVVEEDE